MIAICEHNSQINCLAIVVKSGFGKWHTFQPSQAPLGLWNQNPASSIVELTTSLRASLPGHCLQFAITQQDPDFISRPATSRQLQTLDYIQTARVTVTGSFDDYWAKRGKNLRQNMRRQRNRLARENTDLNLSIIREPDAIQAAVKAYGELESKGWKAELGTAIHIDNSQGIFYKNMLENFARRNQAIVFQYHYGEDLVATDFCIIGGESLIILKTTYEESISGSSPAMLMREEAFNIIFTEKLAKKIEFYGKVMEWHTRWADEFRTMYHLNSESAIGSLAMDIYGYIKRINLSKRT